MQHSPPYPITPVSRPIEAVIRPPGSKSITNRALVVAALADAGSASRLEGPLDADDTTVMREGLRRLGVLIDDVDDPWLVLGTGGRLEGDTLIDAGASGTTARFLTAVATLADGPVTIDGTARMRERPIGDLTDALRLLGASVRSPTGCPPVTVQGPLAPGRTLVAGSTSSQFLSALLLVAPTLGGPVEIEVVGELVSRPYVSVTLEVMAAFGASIEEIPRGYRVAPTGYRKAHFEIEADASAAVYPAVAVAIAGGRVTITGIPSESTQADLAVLRVLEQMGCRITRERRAVVIERQPGDLVAIDVDLSGSPDGALAVAVACLFADGPSRIRGLGTLRVKESDRLEALRTELTKLGGEVEVDHDTLVIRPGPPRPAEIETYDDHRMAMSFALAGLRIEGVRIRDPACVAKTWPGFFADLEGMCRG
jgi:3-phosphoshikimate 1-carboxyvinyltransferase